MIFKKKENTNTPATSTGPSPDRKKHALNRQSWFSLWAGKKRAAKAQLRRSVPLCRCAQPAPKGRAPMMQGAERVRASRAVDPGTTAAEGGMVPRRLVPPWVYSILSRAYWSRRPDSWPPRIVRAMRLAGSSRGVEVWADVVESEARADLTVWGMPGPAYVCVVLGAHRG